MMRPTPLIVACLVQKAKKICQAIQADDIDTARASFRRAWDFVHSALTILVWLVKPDYAEPLTDWTPIAARNRAMLWELSRSLESLVEEDCLALDVLLAALSRRFGGRRTLPEGLKPKSEELLDAIMSEINEQLASCERVEDVTDQFRALAILSSTFHAVLQLRSAAEN